jgi:hypothetical protein
VDGLASFAVAVTAAFPAAVVRPCAAPSSATRRREDGKRNDQPARLAEGQLKAPDETSPTLARLQQAR